jgi:spermidine synthase
VSSILYGTAVVLLLISALGYWIATCYSGVIKSSALMMIIGGSFFLGVKSQTSDALRFNCDSAYAKIQVVDLPPHRYLIVNGAVQSGGILSDASQVEGVIPNVLRNSEDYIDVMEAAALLRKNDAPALAIGLGAGLLPRALREHHGIKTDFVEIDPVVLHAAKNYFGFKQTGKDYIEDGRTFLNRDKTLYSLIFLDAFFGENPPYQLYTREAFADLRKHLAPGGVLSINVLSPYADKGRALLNSFYKTALTSFPHVHAFYTADLSSISGNVVFFCSDQPMNFSEVLSEARPGIQESLKKSFSQPHAVSGEEIANAILLSDNFAPLERLMNTVLGGERVYIQKQYGEFVLLD